MKTSNLTSAVCKTLVIKLLKELRIGVKEISVNFNKQVENIKMKTEDIKNN